MTVPTYLPYYVLIGSTGIIAAVLIGLNLALVRANWQESERRSAIRRTTAVLIGWFALAVVLASFGVYRGASDRLPTIPFGVLLPILIGSVLIWRSPAFSRLIEAVPQPWLIAVQLYRALGVIFLVLYSSDKLPGLFAWPAGAGDIAVGLLAPVVALAYARDPHAHSRTVSMWNLFGIGDLVVAVGTGFLTSPSPFQFFAFEHPNELISVFPLVLIPTFLVPLSVLLHLISLTKLGRATAEPKTAIECDSVSPDALTTRQGPRHA